jgi:hypothetical protein
VSYPSDDPGPWAGDEDPWGDGPAETTEQQLEQALIDRIENEREVVTNQYLWERYAHRLTKDGSLIR